MFDLTTLDYIYIGVLLVSTIWASIRGGVYETVAMVSWIVAALAARFISPYLDTLFQHWFKLSESTIGTLVAAYFIIFFVILLTFSFFNQRLRDKVHASMMKVADHTFGIVFGIIRGIVVMGLAYWVLLWYYSGATMPAYVANARTRPVMQLTAVKIHKWFIPGQSKLLNEDTGGGESADKVYQNLINPAVKTVTSDQKPATSNNASVKKETTDTPESKPASGANPAEPSVSMKVGPTVPTVTPAEKPAPNPAKPDPAAAKPSDVPAPTTDDGTGYRGSERDGLDNKLLQIESTN
ncbi:MAG: CvpA family protein [Proteobacteria bacterium]|nr:CvpA family protein [Pseudomonadota bacterium]